jgi:hypothetical protein
VVQRSFEGNGRDRYYEIVLDASGREAEDEEDDEQMTEGS